MLAASRLSAAIDAVESATEARRPRDRSRETAKLMDRSKRALTVLVGLLAIVAGGAFAWFQTFGTFAFYDDEGYFQAALALVRGGARLYDDVQVPYGPAYFALRGLAHGPLSVPLSTDGVRLVLIVLWMISAALAAWIVRDLLRGSRVAGPLTIAAFALTLHHLRGLANEPGHPQDLALCLSLALIALSARKSASSAFGAGTAWAGLTLVKVNLGVFAGLALAPLAARSRIARTAWFALGLALPWVLVQSHLNETWAAALALAVNGGWAAAFVALRENEAASRAQIGAFLAGAAACAVALLVWLVARHSSLQGTWQALVVQPSRFMSHHAYLMDVSLAAVPSAVASVAAAVWLRTDRPRWRHAAQIAFALGVPLLAWTRLELVLPVALPWCWLVLHDERRTTRGVLVLSAPLLALQTFPVSGTQLVLATTPVLVCALVALGDVLEKRIALARMLAALSIAALALLAWRARAAWTALDELPLHGARLTRFETTWGARLRCLADTVEKSDAAFLGTRGDHSIGQWAQRAPISATLTSHTLDVLSSEQEEEITRACRATERIVVLDPLGRHDAAERASVPLLGFIDHELVLGGVLDGEGVYFRESAGPLRWSSCALLAGMGSRELELRLPAQVAPARIQRVQITEARHGTLIADSASQEPGLRLAIDARHGVLVLEQALPADVATFARVHLLDGDGVRIATLATVLRTR
jgi:hypothetical protein